jgi:opacity protein-like surface antigen
MKKLIYSAIILLTTSLAAQAQDTVKDSMWGGRTVAGAAQIQVMYRQSDLSQLNTALNKNGIPSLGENSVWINLSMNHIHGKFMFEDGLGFTEPTKVESSSLKTSYNQYQAFFRGAYNVSQNSNFTLFPFVGINFSAAVLNIKDKAREQSVSDFTQQLLNTTSSKTLYQSNFGIELGGGFDYLIKLKTKQMDCVQIQRSIPVGVRVGYYFNAAASDWKIDDYKLANGPGNKQSAVFATLNIGLGYVIKR